jgi:hypothetical protein
MGAFASPDEVAPPSSELAAHETGATAPAEPLIVLPALPPLAVVPALPPLALPLPTLPLPALPLIAVVLALPPLAVVPAFVSRPPQPTAAAAANIKTKLNERAIKRRRCNSGARRKLRDPEASGHHSGSSCARPGLARRVQPPRAELLRSGGSSPSASVSR